MTVDQKINETAKKVYEKIQKKKKPELKVPLRRLLELSFTWPS